MSYLGRKPIKIPADITISLNENNFKIIGPLGTLSRNIDKQIEVELNSNKLTIKKPIKKQKQALWGLYRSLIANMIKGVSQGFNTQLEMVGVGYKAEIHGNILNLKLGYSHPIKLIIPDGIHVSVAKSNRTNLLILSGIDNEKITSFTAKIRDFRRPEPYKGKGLSYLNEEIRRKEGKKK